MSGNGDRIKLMKRLVFSGYVLAAVFLVILPVVLFAAEPAGVPKSIGALVKALCNIANWFFGILLVLAVISFLYSGFLFLTAGGSSEKISRARTFLIYAGIGTAIAFLARASVFIIGKLLGATISDLGC